MDINSTGGVNDPTKSRMDLNSTGRETPCIIMNNFDPKYVSLRLLACGGELESAIATIKQFTNWNEDIETLSRIANKIYAEYHKLV